MDYHMSPLGLQGNHGTAESQGPALNSKKTQGDFPAGPGVQSMSFHCTGHGLIPGQGTEIPQAEWRRQSKDMGHKCSLPWLL